MKTQIEGVVVVTRDRFSGRVTGRHVRIPVTKSKLYARDVVTIMHWVREHIDNDNLEGKKVTITLEIEE